MVQADYVLPSLEDARALYGSGLSPMEAGAKLKRLGCAAVVIKAGEQGAFLWREGDAPTHVPCKLQPSPMDVMGAGDAFVGGFITGLLDDLDCLAAVTLGNQVAGHSVQLPGNIESLPTRAELNGSSGWTNHVFR